MRDYGRLPEIKSELTFQCVRKLFDGMMSFKGINQGRTYRPAQIVGQLLAGRPGLNAIRCVQLRPLKRIRI